MASLCTSSSALPRCGSAFTYGIAEVRKNGRAGFMANLLWRGNWLERVRFRAPPRGGPPVLHKAKRATSWAARFALCSVQKKTGQQIERVVALRKLRIATITIP